MELTLYHRLYCHLCAEMEQQLRPLAAELGLTVRSVNVDDDPTLEARFGLLVPVLVYGSEEICHYRLDASTLRRFVAAKRAKR